MEKRLHIEMFVLGAWQTNCFVVHAEGGEACWLVDVGFEPSELLAYVEAEGLTVERVLLTHGHVDHIAGLHEVRGRWGEVPIAIHGAEQEFLTEPLLNLSEVLAEPVVAPAAAEELVAGQVLELDGVEVSVRHVPGHSPGGVALVFSEQGEAIVGDTLFAGGMGRFDFPTSDGPLLLKSIHEQLLTLPDGMQVYPGHGPATTVGRERETNPYLQAGAAAYLFGG